MGTRAIPPWSGRSTDLGSGASFPSEEVGPVAVVVGQVVTQQATEMRPVQHHDVVEALAAQGPDETFDIGILPRDPRGDP